VKPEFIIQSIDKPWFSSMVDDKGELLFQTIGALAFKHHKAQDGYIVSGGCNNPAFLNLRVVKVFVKEYNPDIIKMINSALAASSPIVIKQVEKQTGDSWADLCNSANNPTKNGDKWWVQYLNYAGEWAINTNNF
jgi:hypothetical protein